MSAALSQVVRGWEPDPLLAALLALSAGAYLLAARRARRWPARRTAAWLAGLALLAVALQSGLDPLGETLLSAHMVQHLLLVAVVPPLLLAGAPLALALRTLAPAPRRGLARLLGGRAVRALTHPLLALALFAAVTVGTHVPAFYEAALREPPLHALEHALYLWSALVLWMPVLAVAPHGRRALSPLPRLLLVLAAMPAMIGVGVAIATAPGVVYAPYADAGAAAAFGTTPLGDQRLAGMLMWVAGSTVAGALALAIGWRAIEAEEARQVARERAADAAAAAATTPRGGAA